MQPNLHLAPVRPEDEQPPVKRIRFTRKGTRSCWECKHRKVRCYFASDDDQSCRGCQTRGTVCRSQDLPEPDNTRESERASINDRLGNLERLLGRVLDRLDTNDGIKGAQALESAGDNSLDSSPPATPANENAPALSLFDNEVLGSLQRDVPTPNTTLDGSACRDLEKLRKLFDSLPLESALAQLEKASTSWWLIKVQCLKDWDESLLPMLTAARSDKDPTAIARVLLWLALCLQQLPKGFDNEALRLPYSPARLIKKCLRLTRSISSDENVVSSIVGLECLILQGVLYNNDGKLRSSWLSYRRALNVAQIIGLHRLPPEQAFGEPPSLAKQRHLFRHIIYADRYLSLMLGMNHGISDVALDAISSEDEQPVPNLMEILCRQAGSIIERNQRFKTVSPSMLRITETIDSALLSPGLLISAEDSFPQFPEEPVVRGLAYRNLMEQLWYNQLMAWLHLPLFLKSGTDERLYEYSRESCLGASRNMITSYASIRRLTAGSFCCKSLDFQAFTAAVTLLINLLGPPKLHASCDDWPAIETVMTSLENLADTQPPDKVATRALNILRILKRAATQETTVQSDNSVVLPPIDASGRMKVQIPYFGTICLYCHAPSGRLPMTQQPNTGPSNQASTGVAFHNALSFNVGNTMDATTTMGTGTLPETHLEPGSIDTWSFDPDLTELPSFLPSLEEDWDLAF